MRRSVQIDAPDGDFRQCPGYGRVVRISRIFCHPGVRSRRSCGRLRVWRKSLRRNRQVPLTSRTRLHDRDFAAIPAARASDRCDSRDVFGPGGNCCAGIGDRLAPEYAPRPMRPIMPAWTTRRHRRSPLPGRGVRPRTSRRQHRCGARRRTSPRRRRPYCRRSFRYPHPRRSPRHHRRRRSCLCPSWSSPAAKPSP